MLIALVQMGSLEIHLWGSRADRPEQPDRVVFDLDPDPTVPWQEVVAAAHEVRERIEALGLEVFCKTTGGKGVHLVVPIRRGPGWQEVKEFSDGLGAAIARGEPSR